MTNALCAEGATMQSPFAIPREDVEALMASEGFLLLRRCLAGDADFCSSHDACDADSKATWLLHRDILHALIMPVVELFKRASALAEAALCTSKTEDLELAFSGEARGAFLCLQCFISEEQEWCKTTGCPACVTTAVLSTESHLRLTIAASLLSTASISSPNSSPAASTTSSPSISPVDETPPTNPRALPPLPHILPALREALSHDPFWGPQYWPFLLSRSTQLSAGIQALIAECPNLESLVSSPHSAAGKPLSRRNFTSPRLLDMGINLPQDEPQEKGARLKKSKLAKRQLRMKNEELEIMRRCAAQCWARAAVPSTLRNQLISSGRGEARTRRLTCP
ncbi:hypothetical protein P154DRAFT_518224 [Amniculicola lignicola CBS 123094]|uniref:Uncharacterized protein n=1 Tax=Amniculicola lignicola CBS 123094 TaxID=1392246 RepID=A0A6A5WW11_9PLEO|nr:hypothetical protein P154DRAFT_518224 [Amniculicola lignicola CBS 123094]